MIRFFVGAAIFAALVFLRAPAAQAQDVALTSRDGTISVSGTLLSFDGEFYEVDTAYGRLVLDGQGVRCAGTGCPDLNAFVAEFSFAGAPAMGTALIPALLEDFAHRRGLRVRRVARSDTEFSYELRAADIDQVEARVGFRLHSTGEGFADLLAGETSIAMALREIRADEAQLMRDAGLGDVTSAAQARIVALDALVPIVAPGNPLRRIRVSDLAHILAGDITEWPGGRGPITVHQHARDSGMREAIADLLLAPIGLKPMAAPKLPLDHSGLTDAVARDPFGLSVARFSDPGSAQLVLLEDSCGIALPLSRQALKAEDYPFTAPLFLYLPKKRLPLLAREFLRYLDSTTAQRVIRDVGFVDQGREQITLNQQGERLAAAISKIGEDMPAPEVQRLIETLRGAVRLTNSFRFRGGSSDLDAQSVGNVKALADALERGEFNGKTLVFIGFSDGEGGWEVNRRIARERAEAVRAAVRKLAKAADFNDASLAVEGFGEAMPVACDDTDWGRHANRRVEVWLR